MDNEKKQVTYNSSVFFASLPFPNAKVKYLISSIF